MTSRNPQTLRWRRSSHSDKAGGQCVEVACLAPTVAVRDSKDPQGPTLALTSLAWQGLAKQIKSQKCDLP